MDSANKKAAVGTALVLLLVFMLVTGVILHLKKHGILIEPRSVIKTVHWAAGCLMAVLAVCHYRQFRRVLSAMKLRFRWFRTATWCLAALLTAVVATGLFKLLSPVKVPHLGLWHYFIGLTMLGFAIVHLVRGIPSWWRLVKRKK